MPLYSKIAPVDKTLAYTLPSEPSDAFASEEDFDFASTLTIFSEPKALELTGRFRKDADAFYVEAKRSTVSNVAQIPYWMYGVLVVLGWNEAMLVLFNPLYFAMLLILGASAYVASITRLVFQNSLVSRYIVVQLGMVGPLFQVGRTVANEVHRQVNNRLHEHFAQPALAQPVRAPQSPVRYNETSEDRPDRPRANSRDFATL